MSNIPPSDFFVYRDGDLFAEGVSLRDIVREYGTPTYVYSHSAIGNAFHAIDTALKPLPHSLAYAVKANSNLAILRILSSLGCGADIVSGGELQKALKAGFQPDHIVFSGVGKTNDELRFAIETGISAIHIENPQEIERIESICAQLNRTASVCLRVNPNVDPQTHPYIATGLRESKFGLDFNSARKLFPSLIGSKQIRFVGLATHIGSQLGSAQPLAEAVTLLADLAQEAIDAGARFSTLDVGGGWPLSYGHEAKPYPPPSAFGDAIKAGLSRSRLSLTGIRIATEPGRALVGDAGVLLSEVLYEKQQGDRRFLVVDAAMTELIRPALYGAHHAIVPLNEPKDATFERVDVVGPVCESGDFLAKDREMPPLKTGDVIAIRGAGAYGREMAMSYNSRPAAAEVLVDANTHRLVRRRGDAATLWALEE
ncbi:MAG: diaminopimelate decarboxylase [Polyangiales bacterium]